MGVPPPPPIDFDIEAYQDVNNVGEIIQTHTPRHIQALGK